LFTCILQAGERLDLAESKNMSLQRLVDLRTSEMTRLEEECSAIRAVIYDHLPLYGVDRKNLFLEPVSEQFRGWQSLTSKEPPMKLLRLQVLNFEGYLPALTKASPRQTTTHSPPFASVCLIDLRHTLNVYAYSVVL